MASVSTTRNRQVVYGPCAKRYSLEAFTKLPSIYDLFVVGLLVCCVGSFVINLYKIV